MTDTKELLRKIAALRTRLNSGAEPESAGSAHNPLHAVAEKVRRGGIVNSLMESTLRAAEKDEPTPAPAPRLTGAEHGCCVRARRTPGAARHGR